MGWGSLNTRMHLLWKTCKKTVFTIVIVSLLMSFTVSCEYPDGTGETIDWEATSTAFVQHQVRVMSFNIWHDDGGWPENYGNRAQRVVDAIESEDPDIIGLQEAYPWQVSWLKDEIYLEGTKVYDSYGRSKKEDSGSTTNAILYRKDRFNLLDSGTFWYSNRPDVVGTVPGEAWGNPDENFPRICSWVRLEDIQTGMTFYVFNTHWQHKGGMQSYDPDDDFEASRDVVKWHKNAAELLEERIKQRTHDDPFIVTGDFNATPNSEEIGMLTDSGIMTLERHCSTGRMHYCCRPLWDEHGEAAAEMTCVETWEFDEWYLIDVWDFFNPNNDFGTRCGAGHSGGGRRIDYIFVSRDIDPLEMLPFLVDHSDDCPSDHRPVTALIWIP